MAHWGTADVRNRSLRSRDLRRGALPQGPQGPRGEPGPPGQPGPAGPSGEAAVAFYAHVLPDGTLDREDTKGFLSAERSGPGVYCVRGQTGEPFGTAPFPFLFPKSATVTPELPDRVASVVVLGGNAPSTCPGVSVRITSARDGTNADSAFYVIGAR